MTTLISLIPGTALVLASWAFLVLVIALSGRFAAGISRSTQLSSTGNLFPSSIWWGLTLLAAAVLAVNLLAGLGSTTGALLVWSFMGLLALLGIAIFPLRKPTWGTAGTSLTAWLLVAGAAVIYLAAKALGPITNYDSGLYHLGSIKYAFDYSAIPGIANLYFPFGYSNVQFPLAAFLGNGPWDGSGYRLINGALVLMVLVELTSRLLNKQWTWGTFTLLFGSAATLIPMVAMADDMVTSPTSDTSVMLLAVVSGSYLADALDSTVSTSNNSVVATLVASLTVAFRPTMIIFAIGVLVVSAALLFVRHRESWWSTASRPWIVYAAMVGCLASLIALRDRFLSGWLLYPLSNLPLNVPWRAPDPTPARVATLAAARDPSTTDSYATAQSWDWVGPWIQRLPQQWEPWFFLVGAIFTVVLLMVSGLSHALRGNWLRILIGVLPSLAALLLWFTLSPPSFRFSWGPAVVLLTLPSGAAVAQFIRTRPGSGRRPNLLALLLLACSAPVVAVTIFSAIERNQFETMSHEQRWSLGPISIPYMITPVPLPDVQEVSISETLIVTSPITGDQCWDNYPLCVFYTGQNATNRGPSIQDGFTRE